MAVDLSDDYLTVDFEEAVTLTSTANSGNTSVSVTHAFPRALTRKEQHASAGAVVRISDAYDIPMTLISGYTWKPGDTITNSSGTVLNIWSAERDPATAFYAFLVYDPIIAYDLRHEIDVYRLEYSKDAAGAGAVDAESLVYEAVSCRVQWQNGSPDIVNNRSGNTEEAIIYSSQRLYMKGSYVIEWSDTTQNQVWRFDVLDWMTPDRLDELMQIRVRAIP